MRTIPYQPGAPFVALRNDYIQAYFATQADAEAFLQQEKDDMEGDYNRHTWTVWSIAAVALPLHLRGRSP